MESSGSLDGGIFLTSEMDCKHLFTGFVLAYIDQPKRDMNNSLLRSQNIKIFFKSNIFWQICIWYYVILYIYKKKYMYYVHI